MAACRLNGGPRFARARVSAGDLEGDVEPPVGQEASQPLRPLHQRHALAERLFQPELHRLLRRGEPVAVEMPDRRDGALIDLHQGEGRARHPLGPEPGIPLPALDQRARKGGLARADAPDQPHRVALAERRRDLPGEPSGRGKIGQIDGFGQHGGGT